MNTSESAPSQHTPIHTRAATRADLAFVAWCNQAATTPADGPCYWDALLGPTGTPTPDFLQAVYALDGLAWGSVEDFILIEQEGYPVAGGAGFEMRPDDYRPLRLDRLDAVADHLGWSAGTRQDFLAVYGQIWPDPHDPTLAPAAPWVLECLAVQPEARGQGLACPLVQALIEAGRRHGHESVAISVTVGNAPATRAYERAGFRVYVSYGAEYFEDEFPGTVKYRLRFSPHTTEQERRP